MSQPPNSDSKPFDDNDFAQSPSFEVLRPDTDTSYGTWLEGETERARLERLGRQRPEHLTAWQEVGFVFSIVMSQALNEFFISSFTILVPSVVEDLDIPPQAVTWPTSALTVVISACLIPFGRIADIYGGFWVYLSGIAWLGIMALIISFAQNEIMLDVCRALQGLGPAAYLPAGMTLLGNMYRPGPRKNMIFSIYGSMAPLGFFVGMFFAGLIGQYSNWPVFFWIGTGVTALTAVVAYLTIPDDTIDHKENGVKMDWLGGFSVIAGIVLLVFAITDSSHAPQGWKTPYIYITFTLSFIVLGAAFYIEGWVAEQPLLPFDVFKINNMRPFIAGLLFAYGSLGLYLLYATLYTRHYMGATPLQQVAWFTPLGLGGTFIAIFGGLFLHRMPMKLITAICSTAIIINSLLFAIIPEGANYWAWVFPSMWCATIAVDLLFSAASIFFSTSVPSHQQGLAGAISNVLIQLGIALGLGFADIVVSETMPSQGRRQAYKNAFWFELALGGAALTIFMVFVWIAPAKSDYTADEKESIRRSVEASIASTRTEDTLASRLRVHNIRKLES